MADPDRIRDLLSTRFLHDPQFTVAVNGKSVYLAEHRGLLDQCTIDIADGIHVELFTIKGSEAGRSKAQSGIAFWVGSRLVGEPTWRLGDRVLLDRRTSIAKQLTIVARSDDLFDLVLPDWSAFKDHSTIDALYDAVEEYVGKISQTVFADRNKENKTVALRDNRDALAELKPYARLEVAEFLDKVTGETPTATPEVVSVAVRAVKYAAVHDLRRSFGTRWARRVMPATLKLLMRHSSIDTRMRFYVEMDADEIAAGLWKHHQARLGQESTGLGTVLGTIGHCEAQEGNSGFDQDCPKALPVNDLQRGGGTRSRFPKSLARQ